MGDHAPEAKDEAFSAGNLPAARMTAAHAGGAAARKDAQHAVDTSAARMTAEHAGDVAVRKAAAHPGDTAARRTVAYLYEGSDHHAAASGTMPAGNTSPARKTAAHDGHTPARTTVVYRDDESAHHAAASGAMAAGSTSAARRTVPHAGCSSYADNKAARRTMEYGDEEIIRHAADTVASPGPSQRGLDGHAKKRGNKCPVAQEGEGVKKSRSSTAEASRARAEGSVKEKKSRLIDDYDMTVANKNAMAAAGGKIPAFVRDAAEKEAIKAAAPRMKAITRMMKQMAGGAVPVPSGVPVQRRPQLQPQTDPKPQPQPDPDPEPHLERRPLLRPDLTCPRCHTRMGTEAPHHLCRCVDCLRTTEQCPFCYLAALQKMKCARGMCPSCGKRSGKQALDHICLCDTCQDCPLCSLAKVPRPLPHRDRACPCCCENAGNASSHLCLCYKCKLVPGSECPYCALSEAPSALNPFDYIKLVAYELK